MIIADTNVWSEAVRRAPDPAVITWMLTHRDDLALTSISVGELLFGLEVMPAGRRQQALARAVEKLIAGAAHRIYSYDEAAARELARIRATRRRSGRDVTKPEDAMIAAIASARGCPVATRNTGDFEDMGIELINPWRSGSE